MSTLHPLFVQLCAPFAPRPDLPGYGTRTEPEDPETDEERKARELAEDKRDALAEDARDARRDR
jgi:hypothetical protein